MHPYSSIDTTAAWVTTRWVINFSFSLQRWNWLLSLILPSRKLSKLDESDMQDTAGEAKDELVLRTSIDKINENGFELTKKRSRRYPATTITDADYADDIAILTNTPDQAETLLHSLERAAASIGLYVNAHKTEYMCYNQTGDISTLEGTPLKLVDKFTYLGSSVESTEKDIETRLTKAWTAINRLSIIWKSDLTDKMKRSFFQAAVTSILLYGCTTWTLTKRLEKKLDGNYTRMLRAILNKSWQQHPTRHQLYGHLPPITKTIQVRRTRHAGHCWRSRDELIRDVLLWIPTHGRAKAGRPARTYIQQLCEDTGCCPEDLPRAMNDREEWRERVRDIRATSAIWWWWWWCEDMGCSPEDLPEAMNDREKWRERVRDIRASGTTWWWW